MKRFAFSMMLGSLLLVSVYAEKPAEKRTETITVEGEEFTLERKGAFGWKVYNEEGVLRTECDLCNGKKLEKALSKQLTITERLVAIHQAGNEHQAFPIIFSK